MKCNNCNKTLDDRILIKLTDKNGTQILCPNCIAEAILENKLKLENDPLIIDDIKKKFGAVRFESGSEQYCLEKETMLRLLAHNLTRKEYFKLSAKYDPSNYMLHDDFYDINGYAIQPLTD